MTTLDMGERRRRWDEAWRFYLGDAEGGQSPGLDDAGWRLLDLPHDWSIEGEFREDHPSGGGGGYLPGGIGWYRKTWAMPESAQGQTATIEFDGVYKNCDVWLNGVHLGFHPYGYTGFQYDLTPHLHYGAQPNVLAVRVDDSTQPDARWYSGAGIYRHVWLTITDPLHVSVWGTYVRTAQIRATVTRVDVDTRVQNDGDRERRCLLLTRILDPEGQVAQERAAFHPIRPGETHTFSQRLHVENARRWSVEDPVMYTAQSVVTIGEAPRGSMFPTELLSSATGQVVDTYETPFGIRDICFDADRGFLLNGERVKINGVCIHHDGGCVGAAVPEGVWERRLQLLKAMGCNGIRSSHYPPAPEFLDLCDRYGFLVMDENFDEWRKGKFAYGYHDYFDAWSEIDTRGMVRRDRNHPSIVLWSVGNEIPEQSHLEDLSVLKKLVDMVHEEDPTRPVTSACDNISAPSPTTLEFLDLLDVVGYNYTDRWNDHRELMYNLDRHLFPGRRMIGSENGAVGGIRGDYRGQTLGWHGPYNTRMINAEQLWKFTAMNDYVAGDYMWTGIDYLGETHWPLKNSVSGVIDTCGFPKDGFHFYRSQWTKEPMIHLAPHWNWPGSEGQTIPVTCYTNCETVELLLNGRSLGVKCYQFPRPGMTGYGWAPDRGRLHPTTSDLHLAWDAPYEPGVLEAIGRKGDEVICIQRMETTGAPAALRVAADRAELSANGCDVSHLTVEVLDAQGRLVPTADTRVRFSVEGAGRLIGVDNGDPADHDSPKGDSRKALAGLCLGIVQTLTVGGGIKVAVSADGLQPAEVLLSSE
jgi:beta-galactosidase